MGRKAVAELLGTFWLTFGGVGTVILSRGGADYLGVALAFGLTVVTMAYAIGHISGCHLNPAVTIGLGVAGKFDWKDAPVYIGAQIAGGLLAAAALYVLVKDMGGDLANLGANDYVHGVGKSSKSFLVSALISEFLLTFFFLVVILGATAKGASPGMAGLAIGLCLALIHLIGMGIDGVSVNPARSIGPAIFQAIDGTSDAIKHVWLFVIVPPIGAVAGAFAHKYLEGE